MCHFGDLHSCLYYLYRILHISLVLNRPLCCNLFYTKILYAVLKKKKITSARTNNRRKQCIVYSYYERKKGEKEQPSITKYHCIMSNIRVHFVLFATWRYTSLFANNMAKSRKTGPELSSNFKFSTSQGYCPS